MHTRVALAAAVLALPLIGGCTHVHRPVGEPVTEAGLAAAIEAIRASGAGVEMLEDGLQAEVYRYEWREVEPLDLHRDAFLYDTVSVPSQRIRMLTGPEESVYLPYAWIDGVEARSWPLWAGVEIRVAAASSPRFDGPVVIRAEDAAAAVRLTDAIDVLRRARHLPLAAPAPGGPAGAAEPAADVAAGSAAD